MHPDALLDTEPCPECGGIADPECPECRGSGVLRSEHDADGEAPVAPRPVGRPPIGTAKVPRARLAPVHVAALAVLTERWGCSESEAIRRALLLAAAA